MQLARDPDVNNISLSSTRRQPIRKNQPDSRDSTTLLPHGAAKSGQLANHDPTAVSNTEQQYISDNWPGTYRDPVQQKSQGITTPVAGPRSKHQGRMSYNLQSSQDHQPQDFELFDYVNESVL